MYEFDSNKELSVQDLDLPVIRATSVSEWNAQRAELLELFTQTIFGTVPDKSTVSYDLVESGEYGSAMRKQISITVRVENKRHIFTLLVYIPREKIKGLFTCLNFSGNHTVTDDKKVLLPQEYYRKKHSPPREFRGEKKECYIVDEIIQSGYGFATIYAGDINPDKKLKQEESVREMFPDTYTWRTIAAWSWGLSRVIDYFETDSDIDESRVIVVGHSRMGKAALWAAAQDERFVMAISNNSGCTGAALTRHFSGESIAQITTSFPHWFLDSYASYVGREEDLPVDQHQMLALIAPRPIYVASAVEDDWADQEGEFLSCLAARPAYELYGKELFPSETIPQTDKPIIKSSIGYHIRSGKHALTAFDWRAFIQFANHHFTPKDL